MNRASEINFDGIVGPTYTFAGLSYGNIASMKHKNTLSSPKKAALQGLKKMKFMKDLGVNQAVFPPQERPHPAILKSLGLFGKPHEQIHQASKSPSLLTSLYSASSMWAANLATVIPSADSSDGKVHIVIANLLNRFHRSIETDETYRMFKCLFPDPSIFEIHPPVPKGGFFGDEGAANHCHFCKNEGEKGVHLFVYGRSAFEEGHSVLFPARQALEASEAVSRLGRLDPSSVVFAKQNPEVIHLGVFHNDVISVNHRLLFLYHEKAFEDTKAVLSELKEKTAQVCGKTIYPIAVNEERIPIKSAVESYFFNSQIVTTKEKKEILVAPEECRNLDLGWFPLPILFIDVRQSMQNGGGPACLRLRIELTETEKERVHPSLFLTDSLYSQLTGWVEKHYRDELTVKDLADFSLLQETHEALDALTKILHLGNFYSFQKGTL